ncbi:MAG: Rpn family recombination-promoting nuclease/putative transposase [Muribaculaceae bacterium]|nr:Rpn family recombination-promoting nuclease/putative transposase [Muribaculaceae bacterium]
MAQIIDPLYDVGFKLLLGRENVSEGVLMDFLNAIFAGDTDLSGISELRYMNTEHPGEWKGSKGIRYDIMCQTSNGYRFIVEMQKAAQRNFLNRGQYYACRAITEQGHRGKVRRMKYGITTLLRLWKCSYVISMYPGWRPRI